jgi:hypothetical protein
MKFGGSRDGRLTDLVEGNNVTALDVLVHWLSAQMVLDQSVNRDKVIDNSHHDLQLLDAIPNWDKLGSTPEQSFHLDTPYCFLKLGHVSLIIPWLHVKQN